MAQESAHEAKRKAELAWAAVVVYAKELQLHEIRQKKIIYENWRQSAMRERIASN